MMVDIVLPVVVGAQLPGWVSVNFARADDLKTGLLGDRLRAVKPTTFLGVPRVWEKIADKVKEKGKATKGLKLKIAKWVCLGSRIDELKQNKQTNHPNACSLGQPKFSHMPGRCSNPTFLGSTDATQCTRFPGQG